MIASLASGGTRSTNGGGSGRAASTPVVWIGRRAAEACEKRCLPSALPGCGGGEGRSSSVTRDDEATGGRFGCCCCCEPSSNLSDTLSLRFVDVAEAPLEVAGDVSDGWLSDQRQSRLAVLQRLQIGVCSSHYGEVGWSVRGRISAWVSGRDRRRAKQTLSFRDLQVRLQDGQCSALSIRIAPALWLRRHTSQASSAETSGAYASPRPL